MNISKKKKLTKKIKVQSLPCDNNTKQIYYLIKYYKASYSSQRDRFYGFAKSP